MSSPWSPSHELETCGKAGKGHGTRALWSIFEGFGPAKRPEKDIKDLYKLCF